MDFPTVIYIVGLAAYSLYTWWKKNKAGKNAENSAPKEAQPEVPEWMKEIFGEGFEQPKPPKPAAPRQQAEAGYDAPRPAQRQQAERRPADMDEGRRLQPEVRTMPKAQEAPETAKEIKPNLMELYNQREKHSLSTEAAADDLTKSDPFSQDKSAYDIDQKGAGNPLLDGTDWRKAIILAEVLKPYESRQDL